MPPAVTVSTKSQLLSAVEASAASGVLFAGGFDTTLVSPRAAVGLEAGTRGCGRAAAGEGLGAGAGAGVGAAAWVRCGLRGLRRGGGAAFRCSVWSSISCSVY
jgi:hypothetical protein